MGTFAHMLLAFMALSEAAESVRAAGKNPEEATCKADDITKTPLVTYGKIRIVCPDTTTLKQRGLQAGDEGRTAQVLTSPTAEGQLVDITTLLPGATYERGEDNQQPDTVIVPQLSDQVRVLYFYCESEAVDNEEAAKSCYISLTVPASPPLGPNVCAVDNTQIKFVVSDANSQVRFSCGTNRHMLPEKGAKTYDANFANVLNFSPGVQMQHGDPPGALSTLTVTQLGAQPQVVLFVCSATEGELPGAAQRCVVRIEIGSTTAAPSDPPKPSAAVGMTARTASALCVVFVGTRFLKHFL